MKKVILVISLLFLTSCISQKPTYSFSSISYLSSNEINHEYVEISSLQIRWSGIFDIKKENYYVYIYSRTCSHCTSIRNQIIEFALEHDNLFFVEDCEEIVFKNDINYTIGLTSAENLAILGFPTLLKIFNRSLVKNIAGSSQIMNELKL